SHRPCVVGAGLSRRASARRPSARTRLRGICGVRPTRELPTPSNDYSKAKFSDYVWISINPFPRGTCRATVGNGVGWTVEAILYIWVQNPGLFPIIEGPMIPCGAQVLAIAVPPKVVVKPPWVGTIVRGGTNCVIHLSAVRGTTDLLVD